jgi:5-(aminomethyl)-3-furanmethanol phosphate kinase
VSGRALKAGTLPSRDALAKRPIVVKLGGSVVRSPELGAWLDVIAAAPHPTIVVPGGGALADEVRAVQERLGFGDGAAHRMALLAMDQLAWAVAGLREGFDVGDTEIALQKSLELGRVAVWAPYTLVSNRCDIPESWTVTSDSLALWLAGRIGAMSCYVIKSIARKQSNAGADELARQGIVDAAFPAMLRDVGVPAFLLGHGDQAAFAASLASDGSCGASID